MRRATGHLRVCKVAAATTGEKVASATSDHTIPQQQLSPAGNPIVQGCRGVRMGRHSLGSVR